ncbi:MAG TPA: Do family serine endopeptidase [Bryobacteraceae bacterium]
MRARARIPVLVALIFLLGGMLGEWVGSFGGRSVVLAASLGNGQVSLQSGFEPAVRKILPAVVTISSSKVMKPPRLLSDPQFRQFFESNFGKLPHRMRENSVGSGVISTGDGYILTNSHVVDGADAVRVSLLDGREYDAKIVGCDKQSDLAVIKVDGKGLPTAEFAGPGQVGVGDIVLAIGNSFGVGQTVTMGIVSATGRGGMGIEDLEDFIQTDAAINPGNSGGALVNVNGDLIGINTAILTGGSGGNQGVGFAVPATMARGVMDQIIRNGKVVRGWLGVSAQAVTQEIAKSFNVGGEPHGALVGDVEPGGPAAKADLRTGDIILQLNGASVPDSRQLGLNISRMSPGATVKLKVLRDGKELEKVATLTEMPRDDADELTAPEKQAASKPEFGASVGPLSDDVKQHLKLPTNAAGIVVTEIDPGSAAAQAGLEHGDVIQEINHKPVQDVDGFQSSVDSAGRQPLLMLVDRAGKHWFVTVRCR